MQINVGVNTLQTRQMVSYRLVGQNSLDFLISRIRNKHTERKLSFRLQLLTLSEKQTLAGFLYFKWVNPIPADVSEALLQSGGGDSCLKHQPIMAYNFVNFALIFHILGK